MRSNAGSADVERDLGDGHAGRAEIDGPRARLARPPGSGTGCGFVDGSRRKGTCDSGGTKAAEAPVMRTGGPDGDGQERHAQVARVGDRVAQRRLRGDVAGGGDAEDVGAFGEQRPASARRSRPRCASCGTSRRRPSTTSLTSECLRPGAPKSRTARAEPSGSCTGSTTVTARSSTFCGAGTRRTQPGDLGAVGAGDAHVGEVVGVRVAVELGVDLDVIEAGRGDALDAALELELARRRRRRRARRRA